MLFGAALAAVAACAPHWCAAGEQENKDAAEQIARVLRDSGKVHHYSIGVKFMDGTAWLAGHVTSEAQMQAALEVVSEIGGVTQIVNNLEVQAPAAGRVAAKKARTGGVSQAAAQIPLASAAETPAEAPAAQGATKRRTSRRTQTAYRSTPAGYNQLGPEAVPPPAAAMAQQRAPMPAYVPGTSGGVSPASYDKPNMPNYSWPSYAAYPNYAAVTYPRQYSATAWPFIGPFYPYPQVPMGWRKVSLEWDDGWWFLDFQDRSCQ
jgi:hypothetical protein